MSPVVTQPMLLLRVSRMLCPSSSTRDGQGAMIQSGRNNVNRAKTSSMEKQQQQPATISIIRSALHSTHPTIPTITEVAMSLTQLRVQLTRVMASHTRGQPTCGDSCERRRVLPPSLRDQVVRWVGNHLKPVMAARDQAVARWRDVGWEAANGLHLSRCANHPQRTFERRHCQLISRMADAEPSETPSIKMQ